MVYYDGLSYRCNFFVFKFTRYSNHVSDYQTSQNEARPHIPYFYNFPSGCPRAYIRPYYPRLLRRQLYLPLRYPSVVTPSLTGCIGAAIDVCCVSGCQGVPCPTGEQYDNAVHCASQCPLGTGTPHDVVEYTRCRESCIVDNYPSGTSSSTASTSSTSSDFTSTSTTPSATSFSSTSPTTTSDWGDPSSTSPSTSMNTSTFSAPSSSGYSSSDSGMCCFEVEAGVDLTLYDK